MNSTTLCNIGISDKEERENAVVMNLLIATN